MTKIRYHVVLETSGWVLKLDSCPVADMSFTTKAEAVSVARRKAKTENADLVIHGQDGRVRETSIRPLGFGSHRGEIEPKDGIDLTRPIAAQVNAKNGVPSPSN